MRNPHDGAARVVSIGIRPGYRPDYKSLASQRLKSARENTGKNPAEFAGILTSAVGWKVEDLALISWERGAKPPSDVLLAAEDVGAGNLPVPAEAVLGPVARSFPATVLAGLWITSYDFTHAGKRLCHADLAHVTGTASGGLVAAVNHPPEPVTDGRAVPFRNEIEARLASRHIIGHWRNTSDTRYFGSLHLAVLTGETVMDGIYTGFGSDVEVSSGRWRWVRIGVDTPDDELAKVVLRKPVELHELVMNHSQYDAPLSLADITAERGNLCSAASTSALSWTPTSAPGRARMRT